MTRTVTCTPLLAAWIASAVLAACGGRSSMVAGGGEAPAVGPAAGGAGDCVSCRQKLYGLASEGLRPTCRGAETAKYQAVITCACSRDICNLPYHEAEGDNSCKPYTQGGRELCDESAPYRYNMLHGCNYCVEKLCADEWGACLAQ